MYDIMYLISRSSISILRDKNAIIFYFDFEIFIIFYLVIIHIIISIIYVFIVLNRIFSDSIFSMNNITQQYIVHCVSSLNSLGLIR